ncbi:hypothetical protein ACM43_06825 [Bradyrhizobium sp. CCBAU 45321]|uniref:hypothetical protein n=1 Tax=Bradyrhizobium sp. CCBAU 45321 TaxID=1641878 RepID=UPI002302DF66|nr:hypothetical protein [Bradyrhizobium sp. CCBAU 45321]MDA9544271.1 hypothetical protein [Bradyrhizobium sp. CCBAU 45321]
MFNRKTLFIIGAGAGYDIGVPAGRKLAEDIANRTLVSLDHGQLGRGTHDEDLALSFFERGDPKANEYFSAFRLIHNGVLLANSIDDFLNIHEASPAVVTVGKAAIIRTILNAERGCKLYVDPSNIYNKLDVGPIRDSWFVKFMQVLGPGRRVDEVENVLSNVSFITFNYDRCLEYFLRHALQLLYGIQLQHASEIVGKANIIHPYGSVGQLDKVQFGGIAHARMDYRELSKAIKTYTERVEESEILEKMQGAIREAECIVFLGFAYHKQNMALLRPASRARKTKQIYGTAFGMSDSDVSEVVDELASFFPDQELRPAASSGLLPAPPIIDMHANIRIENKLTCLQLFDYYAKSLAG